MLFVISANDQDSPVKNWNVSVSSAALARSLYDSVFVSLPEPFLYEERAKYWTKSSCEEIMKMLHININISQWYESFSSPFTNARDVYLN